MTKKEQKEFAVEIYRLNQRKQYQEASAVYEAFKRVMCAVNGWTPERFDKVFNSETEQ